MTEIEENSSVVCDNGSCTTKVGYTGDVAPRCRFPSIVGLPKAGIVKPVMYCAKKVTFGDEAQARSGILSLTSPIERGAVMNWDLMEQLWHHTFFNELRVVEPESRNVLLTEPPMSSRLDRERSTGIMFETFNFSGLFIATSGVFPMYASGRLTGTVVDVGDSVTQITPVYEGYSLPHATIQRKLGGRDLTDYMAQLLGEVEHTFLYNVRLRDVARRLKERNCYVKLAATASDWRGTTACEEIVLPDESKIVVNSQFYRCPDALFNPKPLHCEVEGIQHLLHHAIQTCDIDLRRDLYGNIILSGGSTLFTNFPERFLEEVDQLTSMSTNVRVIAPAERNYSVWIGASIMSSLSSFQGMWLTRQEYDECGASIVHTKCVR